MIEPAKLATALRKKYGTSQSGARKVLRRLGLDAAELGAPQMGGENDMAALRVELEQLLTEHPDLPLVSKIFKLLETRAPFDDAARDSEPPRDLEGSLKAIAEKLRDKHGFTPADIQSVLMTLKTGMTDDADLPRPGTGGGEGGRFASANRWDETPAKFDAEHITPEKPDHVDGATDRRRMASDAAIVHSDRTADRLNNKYPGFSRIRTN